MNTDSSFIYVELIFLWMWGIKYWWQGHAIWPHRFTMTILRSQIDWEWQGLAEPVWSYHQKSTIAPCVQLQTLEEYVSTFLLSLPYTQPLPMSTELAFPGHTGNLSFSAFHIWILGSYNYCLPWKPLSPLCCITVMTALMKAYLAPWKVHHHLLFITSAQTYPVTITVEYWDNCFK